MWLQDYIFLLAYHWCEVRMKMYVMGIGKSSDGSQIPKLNEQAAIELGANLLGISCEYHCCIIITLWFSLKVKEWSSWLRLEF